MIRHAVALACVYSAQLVQAIADRLRNVAARLVPEADTDGRVPAQDPVTQETLDFLREYSPRRRVKSETIPKPLAGSLAERYARARKL